jgi:hypothetical protein
VIYSDDVNLLGGNINVIKKNRETHISHHQTTGQNHYTKVANKCLENVAEFKKMEMTLIQKDSIHKQIKHSVNMDNACYLAIQNILSSCLLSENVKIKIFSTKI